MIADLLLPPVHSIRQWRCAPVLQHRPLVSSIRTAFKLDVHCRLLWPEFVSSLEELLEYGLRLHVWIEWITPVAQRHSRVGSTAARNWEAAHTNTTRNEGTFWVLIYKHVQRLQLKTVARCIRGNNNNNNSRITSTVPLQAARPLAAAVSSWMKRGQHVLIVDADFSNGWQPLVQLVHVLIRQKINRKQDLSGSH